MYNPEFSITGMGTISNANKFVGPDYVDNYLSLSGELYSEVSPYVDYLVD